MHTHALAHLDAPQRPPPARQRNRRRPFQTATTHGGYRLPAPLFDLLSTRLKADRRRNSAFALALFLSRMWSAPHRLMMAFPVDRRALAGHLGLDGMSEGKIRGAIASLERCRFLVREVQAPGKRYRRGPDGLQRRPVLFRFGPDFAPTFRMANAASAAGRGGLSRSRRPLAAPPAIRPSSTFPAAPPSLGRNEPLKDHLRFSLPLGKFAPRPPTWTPPAPSPAPDPGLAAALERIIAARARAVAPSCKPLEVAR